ncbi:MAG: hypothetical protein COW84_05640 [Gammaproteobacteria bacterium CG22_combo_CG10-13_8_21_14_all_40_8]|nr:MAG: hypothetical protein COW84_05640 [Gammaproteobacteria bacterium CG22_combo_CG10-13_8_21_14_all_40_8]
MSRPSNEELATALKAAGTMREQNNDPDFIAKSLLNAHYRLGYLEKVFHHAERYIKFGQAEHEHQELLKVIELAKKEERRITLKDDDTAYGL